MALTDKLTNLANAIREKAGSTDRLTLDAMATTVSALPTAVIPPHNFVLEMEFGTRQTGYFQKNMVKVANLFDGFKISRVLEMPPVTTAFNTMQYMFNNSGLVELPDMSSWDMSNITSYSYAFANTSLTEVDMSVFDFSKATDLSRMFYNGANITRVYTSAIPTTWPTAATGCANIFAGCVNLKSVSFAFLGSRKVSNMSSALASVTNIEEIDFGTIDSSELTSISSMIYTNAKVKHINWPDNWLANNAITTFSLSSNWRIDPSTVSGLLQKLAVRTNSPSVQFNSYVPVHQSDIDIATAKGWNVIASAKIADSPEATDVGQWCEIDGLLSKCVYKADTPQSWGQRVFIYQEWEQARFVDNFLPAALGQGTSNEIGQAKNNTDYLLSNDITGGCISLIRNFRAEHGDEWSIPTGEEIKKYTHGGSLNAWASYGPSTGSGSTWYYAYPSSAFVGSSITTLNFVMYCKYI